MSLKTQAYFLILLCVSFRMDAQKIPLNEHWEFRKCNGGDDWKKATVPGTIHTDLMAHGFIPDPFYGALEEKVQWVDRNDWEYKRLFSIDRNVLNKRNLELVFEGLDTYCEVYLNDIRVLTANNMFRTWKIDVKSFLKEENELRIVFRSAQNQVEAAARADSPFVWPTTDHPRMYARKAQYSFGWDWGPKFTTCGIWKNLYIDAWDQIKVRDVSFQTLSLTDALAKEKATFVIDADTDMPLVVETKDAAPYPSFSANAKFLLKKGRNTVSLDFPISNPRKWWTHQLGKPFLYSSETKFILPDGKVLSVIKPLGVRTITLTKHNDAIGSSFFFSLNGTPVYIKGADFIPADAFLPRVTVNDYRKAITDAKSANMNMLRVWGGGVYESDDFYNACDTAGILVWQDFMFACAMYPDDPAFLDNVTAEVEDNVLRLRNHPSLALWCGNNEVDEGWNNWGWKEKFAKSPVDRARIQRAYDKLFTILLPGTLARLDPSRPYHPSSPLFGWTKPESVRYGDQHYWGLWGYEKDVEIFHEKTGRFISEYGMQAMPVESFVGHYAAPEEMDTSSFTMRTHQKHPKGYPLMQSYISKYIGSPRDFTSFLYASQCMQRHLLKSAILIHRSKSPVNMGTIYWQLNDCWPVASWSTVDYGGHWKGGMYGVKEGYSNMVLSLDSLVKGKWAINVSNDFPNDQTGKLVLTLVDFAGKEIARFEKDRVFVKKQCNAIVDIRDFVTRNKNYEGLVGYANFIVNGKSLAENHFEFVRPKDLRLEKPTIQLKILGANTFSVSTNTFAKCVELTATDENAVYSDNYFDLRPGVPHVVAIRSIRPVFINKIKVRSLWDIR